jgi:dienelactone hydrolase
MAALSGNAEAGQFVEIGSGPAAKPLRLTAYLARPAGAGPFPGVVLLHGCGGFHSSMIAWADRLASFGYATLAVDSFGPRGINVNCGGFSEQVSDGYTALRYLSGKPFVRASHIAAMGFSMGGWSVLAALEKAWWNSSTRRNSAPAWRSIRCAGPLQA